MFNRESDLAALASGIFGFMAGSLCMGLIATIVVTPLPIWLAYAFAVPSFVLFLAAILRADAVSKKRPDR